MEHIEKQAGIQKLRPPTSPQPSFGITLRSTACKSRTVIQNSPTSSFTRCPYCGNIYCCWSFLTTCHCFFPHCLSIIATAILMTLNKVKSLTKDHSREATWASVILRFPRPESVWLPRIDGMNGQGKIRTGDASFFAIFCKLQQRLIHYRVIVSMHYEKYRNESTETSGFSATSTFSGGDIIFWKKSMGELALSFNAHKCRWV